MSDQTEKERIAEEKKKKWVAVQKRAFLHWINTYLSRVDNSIDDIITGFHDGVKLITFLEQLTRKDIGQKYSKIPKLKVHKITNCFLALKFLQDLGVKGLTIAAEDIVDATEENETTVNLLLGFCWMLLRQFQTTPDFGDSDGGKDNSFEMRMLEWCRNVLSPYDDIKISGWDSFQDGRALLALVEQFDSQLVNYRNFDKSDALNTAKSALKIADEKIKIPSELIDADELVSGQISDKNLVLYMTLFYNAFSDKDSLTSKESLMRRLHQLEEQVETILNEKDSLEIKRKGLEENRLSLTNGLNLTTSERDELLKWKHLNEDEWSKEKKAMLERIAELEENINMLQSVSSDSTSKLQANNEKMKNECEDLMKLKDKLKNDKEVLSDKVSALTKNYESERKDRERLEEQITKQQNETGLNLVTLRKRLQSYVWDDMYAWKVLLDMKTDLELEAFHEEKLNEIAERSFHKQVEKIDSDIKEENNRLVDLAAERQRESMASKNELMIGEDSNDNETTPRGSAKEKKTKVEKLDNSDRPTGDKKKKKKKE